MVSTEGYDPNMLDVTNLVKASWSNVAQMTIARCWIKSKCLPNAMEAELQSTFGRMRNTSRSAETGELVSLFKKLEISVDSEDPLHKHIDKEVV